MIVTISRVYGAASIEVAHEAGALLGYPVAGDDFPQIAALRLGSTQEDVEAAEYRSPSFAEQVLEHLGNAVTEANVAVAHRTFQDDVRAEIESAIREAAQAEDVVILGGFGNVILRDFPNKVCIFLHAGMEYRIQRIQTSLGIEAEEARKEIERVDRARRRWGKHYYDLVWGASGYYDLAIDVSRFGVSGAARLIANAVGEAERSRP